MARNKAKEMYIEDIGKIMKVYQNKQYKLFLKFSNEAFRLAVKHSEAIKDIKQTIKEEVERLGNKHRTDG